VDLKGVEGRIRDVGRLKEVVLQPQMFRFTIEHVLVLVDRDRPTGFGPGKRAYSTSICLGDRQWAVLPLSKLIENFKLPTPSESVC